MLEIHLKRNLNPSQRLVDPRAILRIANVRQPNNGRNAPTLTKNSNSFTIYQDSAVSRYPMLVLDCDRNSHETTAYPALVVFLFALTPNCSREYNILGKTK